MFGIITFGLGFLAGEIYQVQRDQQMIIEHYTLKHDIAKTVEEHAKEKLKDFVLKH